MGRKSNSGNYIKMIFMILLTVIILSLALIFNMPKNNLSLGIGKTQAYETCHCNDTRRCYPDGCERKTWQGDHLEWEQGCNVNFCGGGAYNVCYDTGNADVTRHFCVDQPRCCFDMINLYKAGSPDFAKACCFPEIGFCHPFYCNQAGNPGGCGHYWVWHSNVPDWFNRPEGYGCVKGTGPDNLQPVYGLPAGVPGGGTQPTSPPPTQPPPTQPPPTQTPPTQPPVPTATPPIARPTDPVNQPNPTATAVPRPTSGGYNPPTSAPRPTSAPTGFYSPFFPSANPPPPSGNPALPSAAPFHNPLPDIANDLKLKTRNTIVVASSNLSKILDFFSYAFNIIKTNDQKLENGINSIVK